MAILRDVLNSRKAQCAAILLVVSIWGQGIFDETQMQGITASLVAYLLGRSIHDHGLAKK